MWLAHHHDIDVPGCNTKSMFRVDGIHQNILREHLLMQQHWSPGNHIWTSGFWPRSRHTSGRSYLTPHGNTGYLFVRIGNVLCARTVLVVLLATYCNLRWVIEQPDGSFLQELPRFQWLWGVLKAGSTHVEKNMNINCSPAFTGICGVLWYLRSHFLNQSINHAQFGFPS